MQLAESLLTFSVLNKITLLLMQCATSFYYVTVRLKCTRRYRNLHEDFGGLIAHQFLYFTARNRCGAYTPVPPDISLWLVRKQITVLKIVTLLAKSTHDLFKLTWIRPSAAQVLYGAV